MVRGNEDLNEVDLGSATWLKVKNRLEARLAVLRKELESDLDTMKTAKVRGKIQELKRILAWEDSGVEVNYVHPAYE